MRTIVVHCKQDHDVYIGRPGQWGNPFHIGRDGTRDQVIEKYRNHVLQSPYLLRQIPTLCGKILGCWCKPLPCHGNVLAELANNPDMLTAALRLAEAREILATDPPKNE